MQRKRIVDLLGAGFGIALCAPLFLVVALAVRLHDGGPVFFRQERIGRDGRSFVMWKFRTMRPGPGDRLLTVAGDTRITRLGCWLRRAKLDELPQLWNVVKGEMSLVGPRPEVSRYVDRYTPEQRRVLELVPGITDPASLDFVDEERFLAGFVDPEAAYINRVMPTKIRQNLAYAARATIASDFVVIVRTIVVVLRRSQDRAHKTLQSSNIGERRPWPER